MDDPLCLFHFPQSNQKAFLFHPRLFKMELELNPEILRIQTFLVAYKFYKQTPSHGFASKNPPAYHGWVKILPSILNSIQSVNHWEWSLYSEFYIKKLQIFQETNTFDNDRWWWVSISEIPSVPSLVDGMFFIFEVILKAFQEIQYLGQIELRFTF